MSIGDVMRATDPGVMTMTGNPTPPTHTNVSVAIILSLFLLYGAVISLTRSRKICSTAVRNWHGMRRNSVAMMNSISSGITEVPPSPPVEIRTDLRAILDMWKSEESAGVLSPAIATDIAETMTAAQFIEWANYVGDEIVRLTRVFHKLSPEKFEEMWQLQPNFASNWILAENYIERLKTTYLRQTGVRT